ncbi:MAG: stage VI sporulation protein F [Firmicutes bacterium]|nr:stage VI sporulation protein F [Bacillota bacterium]
MFGDSFFNKVEKKTNVNKDTILSIASKVQNSNMKDEKVLRDLIKEISLVAGREVSEEKTNKIIETIINDKIPKDLDKMI